MSWIYSENEKKKAERNFKNRCDVILLVFSTSSDFWLGGCNNIV